MLAVTRMSAFFCSELARAENEQLCGTAKQIHAFIALEYPAPWKRKAIESELLPDEVRGFVGAIRERIPELRFLLVRQPESQEGRRWCFVALPRETGAVLYQWQINDYRDLGLINAGALLSGATDLPRRQNPMFLVCTHAQHAVEHHAVRSESPSLLSCTDTEPEFVWINKMSSIGRVSLP